MKQIRITDAQMPRVLGQGLLATAEGFTHADRQLPFHVLIYVLEGAIYVTEDGTDHAVGPGEMLFLHSDLRHYGKRPIPRGTRWYYIHFELPAPTDAAREEDGAELVLPKKLTGLAGSGIESELAALVENSRIRDGHSRWYLNQQLFVLLSRIGHRSAHRDEPPEMAEQIARYLGRRLYSPFDTKALEQAFFLSYKHMAALFKKRFGQTMHAYHQNLRMEEAARLLRETLLPVGEVSDKLGFADQLYFSRCFRRHAGVSPSEYRRGIRDY